MNFLILALPRSRTAWLANALTVGNSFCYHEATMSCGGINDFAARMSDTFTEIVGNSDTANVVLFDQMLSIYPNLKLIAVRRPLAQVRASLTTAGIPSGDISILARHAERAWAQAHFTMDFDEIGSRMMELSDFLGITGQTPKRLNLLESMNVQMPLSKMFPTAPAVRWLRSAMAA